MPSYTVFVMGAPPLDFVTAASLASSNRPLTTAATSLPSRAKEPTRMRSTSRFASNPESAPSGTSLSASSTICGPIASAPKSALASTFATTIAEGGSSASGSASRSTFGASATAGGLAPPQETTKAREASESQRSMGPEASTAG